MVASGTYLTNPYPATETANRRPPGVGVPNVVLTAPTAGTPGSASANFVRAAGATYPAAAHLPSLLLVDSATGQPVPLDYQADTSSTQDAAGNVAAVKLTIPAGTTLPATVRAYVISDVFPLACATVVGSGTAPAAPCSSGAGTAMAPAAAPGVAPSARQLPSTSTGGYARTWLPALLLLAAAAVCGLASIGRVLRAQKLRSDR